MPTTKKYLARFTTEFASRHEPTFHGSARKMSGPEIIEEVADLRRGGTFVAVEACEFTNGRDGQRVTLSDIEYEIERGAD